MKRNNLIFLTLVLLFNIIFFNINAASAQESNNVVINLQIGNPIMTVNDEQIEIDSGKGTAPVVINDRTLVPIRAIIESLNGTVEWNDNTQAVTLKMNNDTVSLVIDSTTAYFNGSERLLDTAPTVINDRTMLPVRFIAESFNLNVGWNDSTQTVTISNAVNSSVFSLADIPPYSGSPYTAVNNNVPYFSESDYTTVSFENYSPLDSLGRCGAAFANIGQDIMPTEERGAIGVVKPTGWQTIRYENIDGKYLYNRCHLIGFQLSGENANTQNLITGTRYMNTQGMLPFENMIADYVHETNNHVLYRVTPVFDGNNLLAAGVLMEALSMEDNGADICFNVFCYNVQPGIKIDYATGMSEAEDGSAPYGSSAVTSAPEQEVISSDEEVPSYVGNKNTMKFHYPDCSSVKQMKEKNKVYLNCSRYEAVAQGYSPCGNCRP